MLLIVSHEVYAGTRALLARPEFVAGFRILLRHPRILSPRVGSRMNQRIGRELLAGWQERIHKLWHGKIRNGMNYPGAQSFLSALKMLLDGRQHERTKNISHLDELQNAADSLVKVWQEAYTKLTIAAEGKLPHHRLAAARQARLAKPRTG